MRSSSILVLLLAACTSPSDTDPGWSPDPGWSSDPSLPDAGTNGGNGSNPDSGNGSGSSTNDAATDDAPPYTGPSFTMSVDNGPANAWTFEHAAFETTDSGKWTWLRATYGGDMIDINFGSDVPAEGGLYLCKKNLLPSSAINTFMYWVDGDNGYSWFPTECGADVQSQACTVLISQADGATGRLRGTFTASVGCPDVVHRLEGSFDVMMPLE